MVSNMGKRRGYFEKMFFPLPMDQSHQGFAPNAYIRVLRFISRILIRVFCLNGDNRFSNEFIQALNPIAKAVLPKPFNANLVFRTGHGRLFWRAKSSWDEEKLLLEWIDGMSYGDCFFDIGANVGNFAIYAASKGIETYAIEAELLNASLLYENIFLNDLQNTCIVLPYCLADQNKIDTFYLKDISKGDALHSVGKPSHMLGENAQKMLKKMPTPVFRLDDLIAMLSLKKPSHIKLDVDGNELQIVLGGIKTFESAREIHIELDTSNKEHKEVFILLAKLGFEIINKETVDRAWNLTQSNYIFRKQNAM